MKKLSWKKIVVCSLVLLFVLYLILYFVGTYRSNRYSGELGVLMRLNDVLIWHALKHNGDLPKSKEHFLDNELVKKYTKTGEIELFNLTVDGDIDKNKSIKLFIPPKYEIAWGTNLNRLFVGDKGKIFRKNDNKEILPIKMPEKSYLKHLRKSDYELVSCYLLSVYHAYLENHPEKFQQKQIESQTDKKE